MMTHEDLEIRSYPASFRTGGGKLLIHANLFNERSADLDGFREVVRPA